MGRLMAEWVFGYASRCGPLKAWQAACKKASIPYLPPHSAGRHGFGQEMKVRQGVDGKAVAAFVDDCADRGLDQDVLLVITG